MSVWIERGDDKENCHSRIKKSTQLIEIIFVDQSSICDTGRNIEKPQQVRDDEVFTKWNIIIKSYMDHMKMCGNRFFYI